MLRSPPPMYADCKENKRLKIEQPPQRLDLQRDGRTNEQHVHGLLEWGNEEAS
jgi:hypothetical protein